GLRLITAVGAFTLPLLAVEGARPGALPAVIPLGAGGFEVIAPFARTAMPAAPASVSLQSNPSDLLYATFLGGSSWDSGLSIAVDGSGAVYVTGYTSSSNFPTTSGAFDSTYNGGNSDAFIVKLNPAGQGNADLLYATFLGGSGYEEGYGIAVDGSGVVYVTGYTWSSDFPTTPGAFDSTYNGGGSDGFLVKLNPAGQGASDLLYATFLGGSNWDEGLGIAVDESRMVYVVGSTISSDFPVTPGAYDTTCGTDGNCNYDGTYRYSDFFVVKLNLAGQGLADLVYSTFLGGSNWEPPDESGFGIVVDGSGTIYVTGGTDSSDFPVTPGAYDTTCGTDGNCNYDGTYYYPDAFLVKLNPAGQGASDLLYATFLGGGNSDGGSSIAVDGSGAAYVVGVTFSNDFPTTPGAFDTSQNGVLDAFIVRLNPAGQGNADLVYATFLGGSNWDSGYGLAVDGGGAAYVVGWTDSSDFPTTPGAYDTSHNGGADAFVVKLAIGGGQAAPDLVAAKSNNVGGAIAPGNPFTWTVTISNTGSANASFAADQVILRDDLPSGATYGPPSVQNFINVTGNIACSIASNTLTCTANGGPVTLGAGGAFAVAFSVTPTTTGTLTNPASGGLCRADPNGVVAEGNENNNDCADSVMVRYRLYLPLVLRNY
ncbi:MAG TPA: SBBP repeat-containing protein, partial [Thermoflexus sp.]|nr:SBBP repeat-containing protein [Thermoflexus sp.]